MNRKFIEVPLFTKRWSEIGLGNEALLTLQVMLLKNPESGPVIEGTGASGKSDFLWSIEVKVAALESAI